MASDCIVPVVEVKNVREHPNASLLSIVEVLGYQLITALVEDENGPLVRKFLKGARDDRGRRIPFDESFSDGAESEEIRYSFRYKEGDRGVYFPADTVLTDEWAEKFDVTRYLGSGNRVKRSKLRGEVSFGLLVQLPEDGKDWPLGHNCADYFEAKKWEPPIRAQAGDAAPYDSEIDPYFIRYTDIQNGKLLYEKFRPGEEVIATEKIHGANSRIASIRGGIYAGSRTTRRKEPETRDHNTYWFPTTTPGVEELLASLSVGGAKTIVLFGEVYGGSVQSLDYGIRKGAGFGYRAFDLYIDGSFLDYDEFISLCDRFGVETAPLLYRGPFDLSKIQEISDGKTTLTGASHIREGVVVRPVKERTDPSIGRLILKFIGARYELSKFKKKDTTDT